MTQQQKVFIGLFSIGLLLIVGVVGYLGSRNGWFGISASETTTTCLTALGQATPEVHEGEINNAILGISPSCSPEGAYTEYDYTEALNPGAAELVSVAKVKLADQELGDVSAYRTYGLSLNVVGVSAQAGPAAAFKVKLKNSGTFNYASQSVQFTVLVKDATKLTVQPGWQWIFNKDTIKYTVGNGTAPYTFTPSEVSEPVFDGTTSWKVLTGQQATNLFTQSGTVSFEGNVMKVTGGSKVAVVVGDIADTTGKKFKINYLNLPDVTMAFTANETLAAAEVFTKNFTQSDLLGEQAYRVMPDNSLTAGIAKFDNTNSLDSYTFYGVVAGSSRILVLGQIAGYTTQAQGADFFKSTKVGVINVTVSGTQAQGCTSGQFTFTHTPNAWNVKTYNFTPSASSSTIYKTFNFLGSEKPVSAYTYSGSGTAYTENGAVTPGQGFWFNSGAQSPICVPSSAASTSTATSVDIKGSLFMVGNPTASAIKWDSVKIIVSGKEMSIFEAAAQDKPIIKAIFEYVPGSSGYQAYYSGKYPDLITGTNKNIDALKGKNWESGKGYWFALNSGVTSAKFKFK